MGAAEDVQAMTATALMPVYRTVPMVPVRGEGVYLYDEEGHPWLDFYAGHAVALLGYGHPKLLNALAQQAGCLFFQSNAVPLPGRERAARRLLALAPAGLERVFFVNSGAEANENALRLALRATGRRRVVALEGAFHGRTAAAAAVTNGASRWYGFPSRPFEVTFVPFGDEQALAEAVTEEVAAVILEPVQGVAGARPVPAAFFEQARELTAARGALLIADEVQCGMGRTGYPFACQRYGVHPDLLTVGKGLAGGFPAAAVLARAEVAAAVGVGDLGSTFGGGPLACALLEAVLDALEEDGFLARVAQLGERLLREGKVGPVVEVSGLGLLLGLRTRPPAQEVLKALRQRYILAGESADPHVLRLLPPLVIEDQHVDRLLAALAEIEP